MIDDLIYRNEGDTLDFKRDQYKFIGEENEYKKSELLKDFLALANSWGTGERLIIVGVKGNPAPPHDIYGIAESDHIDDATIQEFVNKKLNKPISFKYEPLVYDGKNYALIGFQDEKSERPFYLKKDYGPLKAQAVYIRRGSSTDIAKPEEVAKMGRDITATTTRKPDLQLSWTDNGKLTRFDGHSVINALIQKAEDHIAETNKVDDDFYHDLAGNSVMVRDGRGIERYTSDVRKYISELEEVKGKHYSFFLCGGNSIERTGLTLTNNGNTPASGISFELSLPEWLKIGFTAGGKNDLPSPPKIEDSVMQRLYRSTPLSQMPRLQNTQDSPVELSDDKTRLIVSRAPDVPHGGRKIDLTPTMFLTARPEAPTGIEELQYKIICVEYEEYESGTLLIEVSD